MTQNPRHPVPFSILSQDLEPCGRFFKNTKNRLSWKFKIQDNVHELVCTISKLSGKRLIILDQNCLIETKSEDESFQFQYPFQGLYLKLYLYQDSGQLYLQKQSSSRNRVPTYNDGFLGLQNKYSSPQITDIYKEYY